MIEQDSVPEVVYHYTSMNTLLKIVESKSVWATSIRYLNDISEHVFIRKELRNYIASQPLGVIGERLIEQLYKDEVTNFSQLPFIASFSSDPDSLPHWRSYCPNGNGVSIGFRTENLLRPQIVDEVDSGKDYAGIMPASFSSFSSVTYVDPQKREDVEKLLNNIRKKKDEWEVKFRASKPEQNIDEEGLFSIALNNYASRTKSKKFESEREYRLIVEITQFSNPAIVKFRPSRNTLVPYVEARLVENDYEDSSNSRRLRKVFIESVKIGPTPNSSLSQDSICEMFRRKGWLLDVSVSNISFRDWL